MPSVVILGGGLAGNVVARLLRRELPHVEVTLVEARTEVPPKVGESLVERASMFFIRRLGLSSLLYRHHVPKNGLRFFAGDGPLETRSEIGLEAFPYHPSFQLDRPLLEEQLLRLNAEDGVQVLRGWKVNEVRVEPNEVFIAGPDQRTLRPDVLVDATGRRRLLARQMGLGVSVSLANKARWQWLRGAADLDALGDDAWRQRYHHTARGLATCHFLDDQAWTWWIPLPDGLTSVGCVSLDGRSVRLHPHLVGDAQVVAEGRLDRLAYGTRRVFGRGWALVGDAAFATDPLYSPGLDFVADQAEQLVELIRQDFDTEHLDAFEGWQQQRFTSGLLVAQGQYPVLGDFDVFRVRQALDIGSYYNLLSAWSERDILDPRWVRRFLRFAERGNNDLKQLGRRIARLPRTHQPGRVEYGLMSTALQAEFGQPRRLGERLRFHQRLVHAIESVLDEPARRPGEAPWLRPFFDQV